jgi:hypothetical protein
MTNAELGRLLERVLDQAWTRTFGVSTTPKLAATKRELLGSVGSTLRAELLKRRASEIVPESDPSRPGECGVVGYPQGERRVCRRALDHESDGVEYHKDGGVSWIGHFTLGISELAVSEAPAQADPPVAVGAVARPVSSQQGLSIREGTEEETETRPTWWNFRQASAYDAVLHRFCHLESLGALTREEAAIGAALALSGLYRQLMAEEVERLKLRSDLREKGHQP